jgi:hypothetical protein
VRLGREQWEEGEGRGELRRTQEEGRLPGWTSRGWTRRSKSSLGRVERLLIRHYGHVWQAFSPLAVFSLARWQFHHRRWERRRGGRTGRREIGAGGTGGIV